MADGRIGATHPLEVGLNPPTPYNEDRYVNAIAAPSPSSEVGDPSKQRTEVNASGDPVPRPLSQASQFAVVGGTWVTGDTLTTTVGGIADVYTTVVGDTTDALVAAHAVAHFNANPEVNGAYSAALGGTSNVVVSAKEGGSAGNNVTFAVAKTSSAGTYVANGATLTGGGSGIAD